MTFCGPATDVCLLGHLRSARGHKSFRNNALRCHTSKAVQCKAEEKKISVVHLWRTTLLVLSHAASQMQRP